MKNTKNKPTLAVKENIIQQTFQSVMDESYTHYAYMVLEDRALPDGRDGLKPSQRRILVAMNDLHLSPTKKHLKSAKICGDTSGNYHPHGDAVIYPTMVNMAQPFGMRYPLIDPQGNFGSVDGDPPAAHRYTEARLSKYGQALVEELSEHTVEFQKNFDERLDEPTILPAKIPNLLLNGCSGIAVGYATNMPPHNYRELAKVFQLYAKNPNVTVAEMLAVMPGPDFPTGGRLMGQDGVAEYYETGKGSVRLEGVYDIVSNPNGRENIVVTEFPEGGSPEGFRKEIKDLVEQEKISGITDCLNYSSNKEGIKVVVEIGKNSNAKLVLNQLLAHTCLRKSYSINNTLLVNGKLHDKAPLQTLVKAFIDHRCDVTFKKFTAELVANRAKIHVLDGLISVTKNIDKVVSIVKGSQDPDAAAKSLIASGIISTMDQAKAVLAITLSRLTKLEQTNLTDEKTKRETQVRWLENVTGDKAKILAHVVEEQTTLADDIGDDRRTKIEGASQNLNVADLIAVEDVVVSISTDDCIKRVPTSEYRQQARGGAGKKAADLKDEEYIQSMFVASTHDDLMCFTDSGRVFKLKVFDLPSASRLARGRPIINFIGLKNNEKICAYLPIKSNAKEQILCFVSSTGMIKRVSSKQFENITKGGIIATKLRGEDKIVNVLTSDGDDDIIVVSKQGKALRFCENRVRESVGRSGIGVRGMKLESGDVVVSASIIPMKDEKTENPEMSLLTVTNHGYGKKTQIDEYLVHSTDGTLNHQNRGGKGKIDIGLNAKIGTSVAAFVLKPKDGVILITKNGKMIRMSSDDMVGVGRGAMGCRLVKIEPGDFVIGACKVENANKIVELEANQLPLDDGEDL